MRKMYRTMTKKMRMWVMKIMRMVKMHYELEED